MCGRFRLAIPDDALSRLFALDPPAGVEARYNIAPGQPLLAVRRAPSGALCWRPRWGLVPPWVKDPAGAQLINARAETAASKPSFRSAFRARRCLIPADGFYEWSGRKDKGPRTPWLVRRRDAAPFAFAGLWEQREDPSGLLETAAILTTAPNELMEKIHDRMPVILDAQDFELWLDPEVSDPDRLQPLLRPCPADPLEAIRVGTFVNSARNEGPGCSAPLDEGLF